MLSRLVPDPKREVAEKMLYAALLPHIVRAQNELHIGCALEIAATVLPQCSDQFLPSIHAGIGDDPRLTVQAVGLILVFGFFGGLEQGVAETDMAVAMLVD